MNGVLRVSLGLLLAIGAIARGEVAYHEAWIGGVVQDGQWAAWGPHHAWRAGGTLSEGHEEGQPEGIVALLPAARELWALSGAGELRRLDPGAPATWSGPGFQAAVNAGRGQAWLLDRAGLTWISLRDGASPEALARLPLANGVDLQAEGATAWLRQGARLWRATPAGLQPAGRLPLDWRAWVPWRGCALALDDEGRLQWAGAWPDSSGGNEALPSLRLDRLRRVPGALWLRDPEGVWWRWLEGESTARRVALALDQVEGASWLPIAAHALLRQDESSRQAWSDEWGGWRVAFDQARPSRLRDRQVRWAGSWSLGEQGELCLERDGQRQRLGRWPGALSLQRAGAGPLLLTPQGLIAFSEGGHVIGGWSGSGGVAAACLEECLLLAGEETLRTFWTDEEDPWLQHELPLPEATRLSVSPSWAAVLAEGGIQLVERLDPWAPRRLGARPAPEGLADFLLAEDRLLLVSESWCEAWSCREGEWRVLPPLGVDLRGSWLCLRGANHLLSLDRRGWLRQFRLADNLPVREEWRQALPLTGRMELGRDSLRVLGEAGWLDWPLPPLEATSPEPPAPGHRLAAVDRPMPELRATRLGRALRLEWEARLGPASLTLHDLLGRRLRRISAQAGPLLMHLEGLPAGTYVIQGRWESGPGRARTLTWLP